MNDIINCTHERTSLDGPYIKCLLCQRKFPVKKMFHAFREVISGVIDRSQEFPIAQFRTARKMFGWEGDNANILGR